MRICDCWLDAGGCFCLLNNNSEEKKMSDSVSKYFENNNGFVSNSTRQSQNIDPVVEKIRQELRDRSAVGLKKYGTTLSENDLSLSDWLEHLKQELMDSILYIERAKDEIRDREGSI